MGLAKVKLNGKWGLIKQNSTVITPTFYDKISPYLKDMEGYEVYIDDDFGFINSQGVEFIPVRYRRYGYHDGYKESLIPMKRNDKIGFITSNGVFCPAVLDWIDVGQFLKRPNSDTKEYCILVTYKGQSYYLFKDGYLYPYSLGRLSLTPTLHEEERIDVKTLKEDD